MLEHVISNMARKQILFRDSGFLMATDYGKQHQKDGEMIDLDYV